MTDLKVSRFTMVEPLSDERVGLYNTLTRSLGVLTVDEWSKASVGRGNGVSADLAAHGFLVENGLNEGRILAHWRASQAYDVTNLTYIISPTHACNMACSYCIHGKKKQARHMGLDTAKRTLDYIIEEVDIKNPTGLRLEFGGAEALLNTKVMTYLAEGLARFCKGRALTFDVGLISNGLALTPSLIQDLQPVGLNRVRVTISGPADLHNRYRPARDNGFTYERIMKNLSEIAKLIRVTITGQYNPDGGEFLRFPELLDDLSARGLKEQVAEVSFGPFIPDGNGDSDGAGAGKNPPIGCLKEEDPERCLWLNKEIAKRGYCSTQGPPTNRCLANYRNTTVIDVDGAFLVCPSMFEHPELGYGHVRSGVDFRREASLLARELPDACRRDCIIAPLCDGGCRWQALVRTGNFDAVNCLKKTYEYLTRSYIREATQEA